MPSKLVETISKNIRRLKRTSFKALANKAGVPHSTLEKIIFQQVKDVQVSTLQKIAKALKIKVDNLLK